MGFLTAILLIVLGLLAASSFIAAYSDEAGQVIDKLRPVQGWLGVAGAISGVLLLIRLLFAVSGTFKAAGATTIVAVFLGPILLFTTGFLMGFSMIMDMVAGNAEAKEKANEIYANLAPYQTAMGLASVAVGIWTIFI